MSKTTMRVLKALGNGNAEVRSDIPIPTLRPDYITVRTIAVGLNPTDWKHISWVERECTIGCDFAGIVEEVGSAVTKSLKKGDRVCGFAHGGNVVHGEDGAFGEYLTAKGDLVMKVPDEMSLEEAATVGVGIITCGQGLYQQMELEWPKQGAEKKDGKKEQILIYGGSTATGMHGIQFAKLSGFEVITTCSPRNFDLVKSLGATHAFDYSSPTVGADINALTNNTLRYAWDTISEGSSPSICYAALSTESDPAPRYGCILGVPTSARPRDDVKFTYSLGYTVVGEAFEIRGRKWEASEEDFEFAKKFVTVAERLMAEGKLKPHRKEVRDGGLDGIMEGLKDLREGRVSGTKVVYRIGEE